MWSLKTSPRATILTFSPVSTALTAAPVPRPPQPIRPILIASSPAAWTAGSTPRPVATAPPTATVDAFRKSRREGGVAAGVVGSVIGVVLQAVGWLRRGEAA